MTINRWRHATPDLGKPRVYIQQFLDLKLPEEDYLAIVNDLGLDKPFDEGAANRVMETYIDDRADGSQCDAVHLQRGDGLVVLMTVVSYPYKQAMYDRLAAEHAAKKALGHN